jgi:hypothetical protein
MAEREDRQRRWSERGADLLFQVLTEREETASVAIASNESFGKAHMFERTCQVLPKRHWFSRGPGRSSLP